MKLLSRQCKKLSVGLAALSVVLSCVGLSGAQEKSLELVPVRQLRSERPLFVGGYHFFSAASGLVKRGRYFYVVADDAQVLGYFQSGRLAKVLPLLHRRELPANASLRAKIKPDFEALTWVEVEGKVGLIALCSGSGELRNAGVYLPLNNDGKPGTPVEFDLKPVYDKLRERFTDLNVEGLSVVGDRLRLLQRGNSSLSPNAVIDLKLEPFLEAMLCGGAVSPDALLDVRVVDLGTVDGARGPVRWTFTDLCPIGEGRSVFTAAAEDTDNPYEDGEVLGSAIGVLEADGTVSKFWKVSQIVKLEGIAVKGKIAYVVTDQDDPEHAATLYKVRLP